MEAKLTQLNNKLEADSSLVERLLNAESAEEVQEILKEQGLDFSLEEIGALRDALIATSQNGELNDEDLEKVAGGLVLTTGMIATTASVIGASATTVSFVHTVTNRRW